MNGEERAEGWVRAARLAMNVIGFYDLIEREGMIKDEVQRLHYEAQVYAGGVALAHLFAQLATEAGQ